MLDLLFDFLEDRGFRTITDENNEVYHIQEELIYYVKNGEIKGLKYKALDRHGNVNLFFVDYDRIETIEKVDENEVRIDFKPNSFYINIFKK